MSEVQDCKNQMNVLRQCIICEKKQERGIEIAKHFICEDCQQHLVRTNTSDKIYRHYVTKLRKIKIGS